MPRLPWTIDLLAREAIFRTVCRHRQGARPNILLYCSRRGGSTWLLNTIAAHPGVRYVGMPFLAVRLSRWRRRMPDLARAAGHDGDHPFRQIVGFTGEDERRFRALADDILSGRLPLHPSLAFRSPHFHRVTDRIVFQMTSGQPMIEWFDAEFEVATAVLFRHPIPTALSIMAVPAGRPPECDDFLLHRGFVDEHLTGAQVDLARRIVRDGSDLARHVLDWTLRMLVPHRVLASGRHPGWLALSYERTVTAPDRVVEVLSERLDLPDAEAMRAQVRRPSRTVTAATADRTGDPAYLLERWRERVGPDEERDLVAIPHAFGVDMYRIGETTPSAGYLDGEE